MKVFGNRLRIKEPIALKLYSWRLWGHSIPFAYRAHMKVISESGCIYDDWFHFKTFRDWKRAMKRGWFYE